MPGRRPLVPFAQSGTFTDEETKGTATALRVVTNRYYDPSSCRYLSRQDRFGNPYVAEDDGSATILFFELASMVPVAGATFALAMGANQLEDGDYLSGALNIAGAIVPFAIEGIDVARGLKYGAEGLEGLDEAAVAAGRGGRAAAPRNLAPSTTVSPMQEIRQALGGLREGIYEFPHANRGMRIYVGQSGNLEERLLWHYYKGNLKLADLKNLKVTELLGGKTQREIAEHLRIQQLHGTWPSGGPTANLRNPIGYGRRHLLPYSRWP